MSTAPKHSLPNEADFDPWHGNLDAQSAWKNFGGLTLDEAHLRFRVNPLHYQEDFMFMGGAAFAFYFPIIDRYLRDAPEGDADDDRQASILASCVAHQFRPDNPDRVQQLAGRILDLADHIVTNIDRFGFDARQQKRVSKAWTRLAAHVKSVVES